MIAPVAPRCVVTGLVGYLYHAGDEGDCVAYRAFNGINAVLCLFYRACVDVGFLIVTLL